MTHTFTAQDTTVAEMAEAVFGKLQHTKLARSSIEFLVDASQKREIDQLDMVMLRSFVEYLIKSKGYN